MNWNNILIVASDNCKSLVVTLQNTIRQLGIGAKVYTSVVEPGVSSACKASGGSFVVPRFTSEDYMQVLQSICLGNHVKVVIPTTERELPILSANKDIFVKLGIHILTPGYDFVTKCIDNHQFNGYLENLGTDICMSGEIDNYVALVDKNFTQDCFAKFIVKKYLLGEMV